MTSRWVNLSVLVVLILLTVTGSVSLVWSETDWLFETHRTAAWGLVALVPFKAVVAWRSYRRGVGLSFRRSVGLGLSSLLAGLTLLVAALAFGWMWRLGPSNLRLFELTDTTMAWHWILGFGLLPLFAVHTWVTWPRPRRTDLLSRRAFLQLAGLSLAGVGGWGLGRWVADRRNAVESPRRASGSRLAGMFSGNVFPVTTGAGDGREPIDVREWRLRLSGEGLDPVEFRLDQILGMATSGAVAVLDCTIGWYAVQTWRGVRLPRLLEAVGAPGDRWVRVVANSGYSHLFSPGELDDLLVATHVGGEVLRHEHGYPVRLVAPGRKGWFWVKWVTAVEVGRRPRPGTHTSP